MSVEVRSKLLEASAKCDEDAAITRGSAEETKQVDRRVARALVLVQMGELSAGRQALEGEVGIVHNMEHGEGGEQGDVLMPLLSRPTRGSASGARRTRRG